MNRYSFIGELPPKKLYYPDYRIYKRSDGEMVLDSDGKHIETKYYDIPWRRFDRENLSKNLTDAKTSLLHQCLIDQQRNDNTLLIDIDVTIEMPTIDRWHTWWKVGWANMKWEEYDIEPL